MARPAGIALLLILALALTALSLRRAVAVAEGATIGVHATGTYEDEVGTPYESKSPTLLISVRPVASLAVTPTESTPSATVAPDRPASALFTVTNRGNLRETVLLRSLSVSDGARLESAHLDRDGSGTLTPADESVTAGQPMTPPLEPGASVGVVVTFRTADLPPGAELRVTLTFEATSSDAVDAGRTATGTAVRRVGQGVRLSSPHDDALPPLTLADGSRRLYLDSGADFTLTTEFRNTGDLAAASVLYRLQVPDGFAVAAARVTPAAGQKQQPAALNASAVASTYEVHTGPVGPGVTALVTVELQSDPTSRRGVATTFAPTLTSDDGSTALSSEAAVVLDPYGGVFIANSSDGAGNALPATAATLTLTAGGADAAPLALQSTDDGRPNGANSNPFTCTPDGRYSFRPPATPGPAQSEYFLRVETPGFKTRLIRVLTQPSGSDEFTLTAAPLDGLPLYPQGSAASADGTVTLTAQSLIAFDIPVFESRGLQVEMRADRDTASVGDAVGYALTLTNHSALDARAVTLDGTLPPGLVYARGSLRPGATGTAEPAASGPRLSIKVGDIPAGRSAHLSYRATVTPDAPTGWLVNTAAARATLPDGSAAASPPAQARVRVSRGVFSFKQYLIGRVYSDVNGDRTFGPADKAVAGARVYLPSGQYSVTDSRGMYNFPALPPGVTVVTLDPESLPPGLSPSTSPHASGRGWSRLLTSPLGFGALYNEDFALTPHPAADGAAVTSAATNTHAPAATVERSPSRTPVAPGSVEFPSLPTEGDAITATPSIATRVHIGWKTHLRVNGSPIPESQVGEVREDHVARTATYTYYGLPLRPGPNTVSATAVGPDSSAGSQSEVKIWSPGPAVKLSITADESALPAGGSHRVGVTVAAEDAWGHAAAAGVVNVEAVGAEIETPTAADRPDDSPRRSALVTLRDGRARLLLRAPGSPGQARLTASSGKAVAELKLAVINPERMSPLVSGFGSFTFGNTHQDETGRAPRSSLALFFKTGLGSGSVFTFAYDSRRAINRTTGRGLSTVFLSEPAERTYPLAGDDSTRHEEASSKAHFYARLERGPSYAMFGDMDADMETLKLAGYSRRLTGVKLHAENAAGDYLSLTGARPDTQFARETFDGGPGPLIRLGHRDVVPGSETVTLESRDRRRPDVMLSREPLARGIDYQLDAATGTLFLLRHVPAFDPWLNLLGLVVVYEHQTDGTDSLVITARAKKSFGGGRLSLGASAVEDRRPGSRFGLYGLDVTRRTGRGGSLTFSAAFSSGSASPSPNAGTTADQSSAGHAGRTGTAAELEWTQPLPGWQAQLTARGSVATPGYANPFGAHVTPGRATAEATLTMRPGRHTELRLGASEERVTSGPSRARRGTISLGMTRQVRDDLTLSVGLDRRSLNSSSNPGTTDSLMLTLGADWHPTSKFQLGLKREQNLGDADPTYPTQTTIAARYELPRGSTLFFTSRLSRSPIVPLAESDFSSASNTSRSEVAVGIETRLPGLGIFSGRLSSQESEGGRSLYAVMGHTNLWRVSEELSLTAGYERAFRLSGKGEGYDSLSLGGLWQPRPDFEALLRYELRRKATPEHLLTAEARGRLSGSFTALGRLQWRATRGPATQASALDAALALAYRPAASDRSGLLFSYDLQGARTQGHSQPAPAHNLAADGYYRPARRLELYGRAGGRHTAGSFTLLFQGRAQLRFAERFDAAAEALQTFQPSSSYSARSLAYELGYWPHDVLRLAVGYRHTPPTFSGAPGRGGVYLTAGTRLAEVFNLFRRKDTKDK